MYRVIYADGQMSEEFDSRDEAQQHIVATGELDASIQVLDHGDWMLLTSWVP